MMIHLGHENGSGWVFLISPNDQVSNLDLAKECFAIHCHDLIEAGIDMGKLHIISAAEDYLVID